MRGCLVLLLILTGCSSSDVDSPSAGGAGGLSGASGAGGDSGSGGKSTGGSAGQSGAGTGGSAGSGGASGAGTAGTGNKSGTGGNAGDAGEGGEAGSGGSAGGDTGGSGGSAGSSGAGGGCTVTVTSCSGGVDWTPGTTASQVKNAGGKYSCTGAPNLCSSPDPAFYEPPRGSAWRDAWTLLGACSECMCTPLWQIGTPDKMVQHHGNRYRCTTSHSCDSPALTFEPGVGAAWMDTWELVGPCS